jgi:hypothetical protein
MTKGGIVTDLILGFVLVALGSQIVQEPWLALFLLGVALAIRIASWRADVAVARMYKDEERYSAVTEKSARARFETDLIASGMLVLLGAGAALTMVQK